MGERGIDRLSNFHLALFSPPVSRKSRNGAECFLGLRALFSFCEKPALFGVLDECGRMDVLALLG